MTRRPKTEKAQLQRGFVIERYATADGGPSKGERVLDEIVAYGADVHLEMMNNNEYCLLVYGQAETVCYFIRAARAKVRAHESWRDEAVKKKRKRSVTA